MRLTLEIIAAALLVFCVSASSAAFAAGGKISMMAANCVFCAAVAFVVGCNLYFGPRIMGNRVAMQWGIDGKPTWQATKRTALWGMVVFMIAVRSLIWAAMAYTPNYVHDAEIGVLGFSVIFAAAHAFILGKAATARSS
jgi:hypothetical protein